MQNNSAQIVITARDDASKSISSVSASLGDMSKAAGFLAPNLAAVAGALTAGGFLAWTRSVIDAADNINDLSQRVGISVYQLAGWSLAAEQSGTSIESVAKGVKALSGYIAENGDKLRGMGVDTSNANQALIDLADGVSALPDGIEKTAIVTKLLGKAGMELIPMLNLGSAGLQELFEKSDQYGKRLAELAPEADKLNDQLAELSLSAKAAGINVVSPLTKAVNELVENFIRGRRAGFGFIEALTGLGVRGLNESIGDAREQAGGRINELIAERTRLENKSYRPLEFGMTDFEQQSKIARINSLLAYYRELQLENLPKSSYSNEGHGSKSLGIDLSGVLDKAGKTGKTAKSKSQSDPLGDLIDRLDEKEQAAQDALFGRTTSGKLAALAEQQDRLSAMLSQGRISFEEYDAVLSELTGIKSATEKVDGFTFALDDNSTALKAFADDAENVFQNANYAAVKAFRGMEDALVGFVRTGKLDFKSLANSIVDDMIRIQIQQSITAPLARIANSYIGGLFSTPTTGINSENSFDSGAMMAAFGGGRAMGGPLDPGKWYIAGEHGPEPIWGGGVGAFAAGYDGQDTGSTVTINASIDARGADPTVMPRINAALREMESRIIKSVPAINRSQMVRAGRTPY